MEFFLGAAPSLGTPFLSLRNGSQTERKSYCLPNPAMPRTEQQPKLHVVLPKLYGNDDIFKLPDWWDAKLNVLHLPV